MAIVLWGVDAATYMAVPERVVLRSIALTVEYLAAVALIGSRYGRGYGLYQFRLGPWYLLLSAVTLGLTSITWRTPQAGVLAVIGPSSVAYALALLGLGVPLWTIGYLVGPGGLAFRAGHSLAALATSERDGKGGGRYRPVAVWALAGVAVAARLTQIAIGRFGYLADPSQLVSNSSRYAQILEYAASLGLPALVIAAVELARSGGARQRTLFLVLLGTEIGFGLLSGVKGQFVFTLLAVCMSFAIVRGRLPLRWLLGAAAVLMFVVVPYNATYRQTVRPHADQNLSPSAAIAAAPQILTQTIEGGGRDDEQSHNTLTDSADYLADRVRSVDSLAVVVQKTPEVVPYRGTFELVSGTVLGWVPRALWPGKPVRTAGYTFSQEYYETPPGLYTSAGISPQADLFRYGGLLVMLVGSALLGAVCRFVDETLHPGRDLRLTALFASLFTLLLTTETSVSDLVVLLPIKVGVVVLACRFVYRRRPVVA
ncbi:MULTISPECIES: hypothetical protein [unclassified Pseudofrankia]|uniref:hypothetical protein n=1 Tax=unclassified Pseudofrankia TaxID=2994372 RepID=UPI000913B54C|nr:MULTISPECIES: hypothetical protein [unclassified Pseudofrankia]MDT3443980.1 hypothetical protein [Pseudofrankia sp. BMG5.37]OHV44385.1 hypothetical protein BCD48_02245 [Pseudofrankia sp. BMG5.36]